MHRVLALTLCAASGCYAGVPGFDPAASGSEGTGGRDDGAETGDASGDGDTGADDGEPAEGDFGRSGLRRLTRAQLGNSLRDASQLQDIDGPLL